MVSLPWRDDVVLVLELDRRGDRSKDFLARDLHLVVHAGENRRLDEVAGFLLARLAAGLGGRAFRLAGFQISLDAIVLLLGNQRSHAGVRVERIAERQAARHLRQLIGELIVHLLLHEHARAGAADLALVHEDAERGAEHRRRHVSVGEDDVGRLAAELERDALQVAGRGLQDQLADFGRAGERDLVDIGMLGDRAAGAGAEARDDLHDALGQSRLRR